MRIHDLLSAGSHAGDADPDETREWLEALESVLQHAGAGRAADLLTCQLELASQRGFLRSDRGSTPYLNTLPSLAQLPASCDRELERRLEALVRYNALAIVLRAERRHQHLGGHIASFASAATLYEVGFNHFWNARTATNPGDLVYFQGHAAPGIYARAFLSGRLDAETLDRFRREVNGGGLPSYPHPWLMPSFWQFPTVSMGLGAIQAIYQARFLRYLAGRSIPLSEQRKVWCFLGDGEMDEPESQGALSVAGREGLDNLIFVVNCNLQRLDGPVRGNGKIIQELERLFRAAGWNVIKVVWSSAWDELLANDASGLLRRRMEECVDGEFQAFKACGPAYFREHFFGKYPALRELVQSWPDARLAELGWGGHDVEKVHAAYAAAAAHRGAPSVVLAKTIKGFGLGAHCEARNTAHQSKTLNAKSVAAFCSSWGLDLSDEARADLPFLRPAPDTPEMAYLAAKRAERGGFIPARSRSCQSLTAPELGRFVALLEVAPGARPSSTTMAFVELLSTLLEDPLLGWRVVPIVADEARTFGMEGLFRKVGIWSSSEQRYVAEDAASLAPYRESPRGQLVQEGITEAGAMSTWIAAATSYSTHDVAMLPFFLFYSMFGVQRTGDLWWAAGDSRSRGFLLGATAGRTTLNGEGLQHADGHSHVWAASIPNCLPYDPTFAYEVAVIVQDGLVRLLERQEDVYYYLTLGNEAYPQRSLGAVAPQDIVRGMYALSRGAGERPVELLGSGAILLEVIAAAELLQSDFGISANVWSCPSFTVLAREARAARRWSLLHPGEPPRLSHLERCLSGSRGPCLAATDYVRAFPDQIREFVACRYVVLGTDGFGRSDARAELRRFFEVDRHWIVLATLGALADEGRLERGVVADAMRRYGIDPEKIPPELA
jgi:pyruvate dehydrogenase E1 component